MNLEDFIIANSSKRLSEGGAFVYESVTVYVRNVGDGIFEVTMNYPAPDICYSDRFDSRKMNTDSGELTALYNWIQVTFLPKVEKSFTEVKETL